MNGGKVRRLRKTTATAVISHCDRLMTVNQNSGNAISQMCGEIDQNHSARTGQEESSLPHQDFVYICFRLRRGQALGRVWRHQVAYVNKVVDPDFRVGFGVQGVLKGNSADMLLEDPSFSALLIFYRLKTGNSQASTRFTELKACLPSITTGLGLLQGLLYQTPDWYEDPQRQKKE